MRRRVLVVADDLTGAGDAGVAFAERGMRTILRWGGGGASAPALVVDTDSRSCAPKRAAERVARTVRAHSDRLVFKKLDSTLRGNPAAELEPLLARADRGVLCCPAVPAAGRTVLAGAVHINGLALPHTDAWGCEDGAPPATIADALATRRVHHVPWTTVQKGHERVHAELERLLEPGAVVICDALRQQDLRTLAEAGLAVRESPHWMGAAGLASAVARAITRSAPIAAAGAAASVPCDMGEADQPAVIPRDAHALTIVGSANPVARSQAHALARTATPIRLSEWELPARNTAARRAAAERIAAAVRRGDVVVLLDEEARPDPSQAAHLTEALAEVCAPAARLADSLVLTGGATARAVLDAIGVRGMRVVAQPMPGTVLSRTEDTGTHVITKAGGFGDADTLRQAVCQLRGTVCTGEDVR